MLFCNDFKDKKIWETICNVLNIDLKITDIELGCVVKGTHYSKRRLEEKSEYITTERKAELFDALFNFIACLNRNEKLHDYDTTEILSALGMTTNEIRI